MSSTTHRRACMGRERFALAAACVLLAWAVSAEARAFRLPVNFNQAAAIGGSGGRYFTGSPSDRYTCKVCHANGGVPNVVVRGLPLGGYLPGYTYPISIDWDDSLAAVAFNVEITDGAGRALGAFSVPPPAEVAPAELCAGSPAVLVAPPERTLAILPACGAHGATIRWTAPTMLAPGASAADATQAWFSGSVLVSNEDGSVEGDGVADLSQVFDVAGQARAPATRIAGGCRTSGGPATGADCGVVVAFGSFGLLAWRRRRRRMSPWR